MTSSAHQSSFSFHEIPSVDPSSLNAIEKKRRRRRSRDATLPRCATASFGNVASPPLIQRRPIKRKNCDRVVNLKRRQWLRIDALNHRNLQLICINLHKLVSGQLVTLIERTLSAELDQLTSIGSNESKLKGPLKR